MSEEQFSILLVDDDEVDRLTVKRALKKASFPASFTEVEDGQRAIAKLSAKSEDLSSNSILQNLATKDTQTAVNKIANLAQTSTHNYDLVLLDYRLPDIDGLQLICQIRALDLDLPIVVLTGQGDEEIAVEMMKAGASDYLAKGKIAPDSLTKAISSAIRIYKAERAVTTANMRLRASNELLILKNQELERQQQQIKLQNIKLQESYKLKSEFLATMSHELRTPMNAIMGFSQLLLRQYPDPLSNQQENLIQRILNNSKNLLDMINEMLDFSKIEAGKLELKPERFDLCLLTKLTVEELRSLALQKKLNLDTAIELQDSFLIQDANFIKRTIINLLSNAIKFTEQGEVKVRVWEIEPEKIGISVVDTGIGIPSADRAKIFQAFRQGDQSFTRQHSGTGLGLAITESLVKMMGGKIDCTSELGKGSVFTIEIPRRYDVEVT